MFIGNLIGIVIIFVSGIVSFLFFGKTNESLGMLLLGLLCLILDLAYRYARYKQIGRYRFVKPTAGGNIFYIPVWIIRLAVSVLAAFNM